MATRGVYAKSFPMRKSAFSHPCCSCSRAQVPRHPDFFLTGRSFSVRGTTTVLNLVSSSLSFGTCLLGWAAEVRRAEAQDTHNPKPYIAGVPS